MYRQIKLIDGVQSFSPARDRWVNKPMEEVPDWVAIKFQTGQTGRLDLKDPLCAHWATMIDQQTQTNQPVYVEIDEETSVITEVLIPRVFTVARLEADELGNVLVQFNESHATHGLLQSAPNFDTMRASLQDALDNGSPLLITETRDDMEIIDVSALSGNSGGSSDRPPPSPDPPVTPERAIAIFNDVSNLACDPCNPSSTCIPFQYPDDGCWIRAHLMCWEMQDYSPAEDPGKVWISAAPETRLNPFVPNHPDCQLPWGGWAWHVAPTLDVILPGGNQNRVIDPSLTAIPVSESEWRDMQNSTANLSNTVWTQYRRSGGTATEAKAHADMNWYRNELATRCQQYGPPPYSCLKNLFFIIDRNTISDDEIESMLLGSSTARIQDAFYVVLDGFTPQELGFTAATMQHQPTITPSSSVSGMTLVADRIEFEYPAYLNRHQRLTWVYHIDFTDTSGFTAPRRTITLQATMNTEVGGGTLYLIQQQNPYEIDGPVSWLSTDLRVFQIKNGESRFGVTMGTNPNDFITQVLTKLNDGTAGQTFDSLPTDQQASRLELSGSVNGTAVYNFAIARVRYRSADSAAQDVRVFFRLFPWATTSVEYNQATEHRRYQSGNRIVPLLGKKNNNVSSIPCFASPRINAASVSMTTQTDTPNVKTLPITGGAEESTYFGCWLDINQTQQHFPDQFPATSIDGPYASNRKSIQDHIRNEHQCLVAEIAFLPAPAQNGTTPSKSDKLAQRNLAFVETSNPGVNLSRRIPQTFEIQPSLSTLEHDELMIDWANVPVGSMATIYMPGIDSREVLRLASQKYRRHRLKRIDRHTIKFETGGMTYLPIPFSDDALPGLLTIDLPEGIKKDQVFNVVVKQVTGVRQQFDLRHMKREELVDWRHIVGSFQLTIPVADKADILPLQQRLLSNLRWIERAIPATDRWLPVFGKYVQQVAQRVDALGGDADKVAPSATGEWRAAYRNCLLLSLLTALLLFLLIVGAGTLPGGFGAGAGVALLVSLIAALRLWKKNCRPTLCQILLAVLPGSAIGALTLALLAMLGLSTPQLVSALVGGAAVALATAVTAWRKDCF